MQHHSGGNIFNAYTPPENNNFKTKSHTNIKTMNMYDNTHRHKARSQCIHIGYESEHFL